MTLLDKAKDHIRSKTLTPEQIELAIAWARGDISTGQANYALRGGKTTYASTYIVLARALRQAAELGLITFNVTKPNPDAQQ